MTSPIFDLRSEMEAFLREFGREKALFVPNEGNAGDCLIFTSTLQAMVRAGIDVDIANDDSDFDGRTVFLGGGGNLVGVYDDMRRTIEACRYKAARVVLLPHTIRGNHELIASLDRRFTIWCRDRASFEYVRGLNSEIDCRLGHDMAFHYDAEELWADPICDELGPSLLHDSLNHCGTSLEKLGGLPVVRFMRTDREARSLRVATDLDVSRAFGSVADVKTSNLVTWCFLKTIASAQSVITDRLHVAIACALLGKNCELLDNSYNKNRELFAHSLHRFDCISFRRSAGATVADRPPLKKSLIARAAHRAQNLARDWLGSGAVQ